MTKLEREILANGCGDLTALQWCRERCATVRFHGDGSVSVTDGRDKRSDFGDTLPAAVLNRVKDKHGRKP